MRSILAFCVPVLIGNIFQQFYSLADSFLVGRLLGVQAFAAVGSTGALNFLVLGFALGVCSGLTIPVAQSFGAGDLETMRRKLGQLVWLGLGLSGILTVGAWLWTDDLLRLTQTPADIYDGAYAYIHIVFLGAFATILYNLLSAILRAIGDSRTPLYFLIMTTGLNVALDLLCMGFFHMGVEGAAIATVVSQLLSGLGLLWYIARNQPELYLLRIHLKPRWQLIRNMIGTGLPMGLQFAITAVGSTMLQSAVNGLGTDSVAAIAAGTKVYAVVAAPLDTCGVAMATYCGQNLGAGDVRRLRRGIQVTTLMAMIYCLFAALFAEIAGTHVAALFLQNPGTELLEHVHAYLVITTLAFPMLAVVNIYRNGLQGMGFSRQAMSAGVAELIARALAAFVLVRFFAFRGACFASPLAWLFADTILLILYRVEISRLEQRFGTQDRSVPARRGPLAAKAREIIR